MAPWLLTLLLIYDMKKSAYSVLLTKSSPPSFASKLIYRSLKLLKISNKIFTKLLSNPDRGTNHLSPDKFSGKLLVTESLLDGFKIVSASKKDCTNKHILLFHGGVYIGEASKGHRQLVERLALSGFMVSFMDYPLSPENNALITISWVEKAFNKMVKEYPNDIFFLFGDSAGGGLALALLQILKNNNNRHIPLKTVLVSPWLDISMTNPDILDYISKDVLLSYEGLKKGGKLYAQDVDVKDPRVSPIYGHFDNLAEIKIFVSNMELFYPDCLLLKSKLAAAPGTTGFLSVKEKMVHDWIVLPIRERKEIVEEIVEFYNFE